jgi:uncharacterized protein YlaI
MKVRLGLRFVVISNLTESQKSITNERVISKNSRNKVMLCQSCHENVGQPKIQSVY